MSYMSELDMNTEVSYHTNLWAALGALLNIAMLAAEGAEGHGLADCTDWLTEIGDACQRMNGSTTPYMLKVESGDACMEFDSEHVSTNVGEGYAVNGMSVQAICAAGRCTLAPVPVHRLPVLWLTGMVGGAWVQYEGNDRELIITDEEGRETIHLRPDHLTQLADATLPDHVADDLDVRIVAAISRRPKPDVAEG